MNDHTQAAHNAETVRPAPWYDPVPEGYHFEVWNDEPDWKYDPCTDRICRDMKCKNRGVAAINRGWSRYKNGYRNRRDSWWYYCAEHLYGRWIEDEKVCAWRLVADQFDGEVAP